MNQPPTEQRGASAVELTFLLLGAGIVLIAIFNWLVPAMTLQSDIAAGREGVGLAATLEGSVGRLGEGGAVVDVNTARESATSFAVNLYDNSGLPTWAEAFETRGAGTPGNCTVGIFPIGAGFGDSCRDNNGNPCGGLGPLTAPELHEKIEAAASAECLAKDYYMGTQYDKDGLRDRKGLHLARKLGFQPDIFVPSGGSGSGP